MKLLLQRDVDRKKNASWLTADGEGAGPAESQQDCAAAGQISEGVPRTALHHKDREPAANQCGEGSSSKFESFVNDDQNSHGETGETASSSKCHQGSHRSGAPEPLILPPAVRKNRHGGLP